MFVKKIFLFILGLILFNQRRIFFHNDNLKALIVRAFATTFAKLCFTRAAVIFTRIATIAITAIEAIPTVVIIIATATVLATSAIAKRETVSAVLATRTIAAVEAIPAIVIIIAQATVVATIAIDRAIRFL